MVGGGSLGLCLLLHFENAKVSHIALFFLKDLHGTSATSMAVRIFLVVAFLLIVVSKDLLKMQRFKGTLDFSSLESHKVFDTCVNI